MKPAKAWVPGTAQGRRPCSSDLKLALPLLPAGAWEERGGSSLLEESPGKATLPTANDCRRGGGGTRRVRPQEPVCSAWVA